MPTPSGLPRTGDFIYNAFFKQRFRVVGRNGNSFPMTVYLRPMPDKDWPERLIRGGRGLMPNGTYPLLLEAPPDDMFRMGLSHWTFLPKSEDVQTAICDRDGAHGTHLYLRQRVWFKCDGVKAPEPAPKETDAAPLNADRAFDAWYRSEFGFDVEDASEHAGFVGSADAFRSAFEAGRRFEQSKEK